MGHRIPPAKFSRSVSKCRFALHLFFAGVHRQPRYETNACGQVIDRWKMMDAFEIAEGDDGGLVFVYNSHERSDEDARDWLRAQGYTEFLANGSIDACCPEPVWRFREPADAQACLALMREIANDPNFLRYFALFYVIGPDGDRFPQTSTFCVPDDENS